MGWELDAETGGNMCCTFRRSARRREGIFQAGCLDGSKDIFA